MRKVCFITTVPVTIQAFILDTAKYMHENADYQITIITDYDESFARSLPTYIKYIPVPMERGINLKGINALLKMIKIFKTEKFDLIQYSTPNASLYASLAGKITGVPVRLYCQWGIIYVGFTGIKRSIFKLVEKTICQLSTWIEPDSFGNLKYSHKENLYTAEKSSVVWNGSASGVNLKKFNFQGKKEWRNEIRNKYNIKDDIFIFGFVGRITKDKGINELLEATRNFLGKYTDSVLLIVGTQEHKGLISEELLEWSQKEKRVIYCGTTNEVEKYYAAMDSFILPSYREGFGSVVIEAEAMGIPVIVSNIPGPTEAMISNVTGLIVKKADTYSLENAMIELYLNREKLSMMSIAAKKFAIEKFNAKVLRQHIVLDRERLLKDI